MQEIIITKNEKGFKLRKLCMNYLPKAPNSFFYKMFRKKNIVLNDKKADGTEVLKEGDSVKFYLSEEDNSISENPEAKTDSSNKNSSLDVIYEDENIILCNKPAGILSQKAAAKDYSINEMIIDYLLSTGEISQESLKLFKPSVCNRLDRNTSGIIMASKTPEGAHYLTDLIRERKIRKFYYAVVKGHANIDGIHEAFLSKDEKTNKVIVRNIEHFNSNVMADMSSDMMKFYDEQSGSKVLTGTELIKYNNKLDISLLSIDLITGKSHQIRAHLAHMGFPIIGDVKYGVKSINNEFSGKYNVKHQLLHAYKVIFPDGSECETPVPDVINQLF